MRDRFLERVKLIAEIALGPKKMPYSFLANFFAICHTIISPYKDRP
jgi:hypothetical protein